MAPELNRYEAADTIHPRSEHVIGLEAATWQRAQLRSVGRKRADLQDGCSQCPRALYGWEDDHVQLRFPAESNDRIEFTWVRRLHELFVPADVPQDGEGCRCPRRLQE
jgi:hypothetical protein